MRCASPVVAVWTLFWCILVPSPVSVLYKYSRLSGRVHHFPSTFRPKNIEEWKRSYCYLLSSYQSCSRRWTNLINSHSKVISISIIVSNSQAWNDDYVAMARQLISDCKKKEGASDADEAGAMDGRAPTTRGGKCIHACLAEATGIIKEGKLNMDDLIGITAQKSEKDKRSARIAKQIVNICSKLSESDRCEYSAKALACARQAMARLGVDPSTST